MNKKQLGIILIIIGILAGIFTYNTKIRDDHNIELIIQAQNNSCYLADGTCLHKDRSIAPYLLGGIISVSLILLGSYLILFDKTEKLIETQATTLQKELKETKKTKEFEAFLSGFSEDEKKVLSAVNDQEGIKQSTLRYRTGISKTSLSLLLNDFEKRKIISKKKSGKTNQIFLVKKY